LLDDGRHQELQIIRRDTVKEFLTKNKYGHGLGWAMSGGNAVADLPLGDLCRDEFFAGAFGHTGFTGTFVLGIPENKVSIVVLTNRQNLGVNAEGKYNDLNAVYQSVVNFVKSDLQTLANSGLDASNLQFG
jgi:CubicO group peptidase (beta-lactamase class C family)